MNKDLISYHSFLDNNEYNIEDILLLENNFVISEEDLDKEIQKLMKGVK